jgi:hypothetical protein
LRHALDVFMPTVHVRRRWRRHPRHAVRAVAAAHRRSRRGCRNRACDVLGGTAARIYGLASIRANTGRCASPHCPNRSAPAQCGCPSLYRHRGTDLHRAWAWTMSIHSGVINRDVGTDRDPGTRRHRLVGGGSCEPLAWCGRCPAALAAYPSAIDSPSSASMLGLDAELMDHAGRRARTSPPDLPLAEATLVRPPWPSRRAPSAAATSEGRRHRRRPVGLLIALVARAGAGRVVGSTCIVGAGVDLDRCSTGWRGHGRVRQRWTGDAGAAAAFRGRLGRRGRPRHERAGGAGPPPVLVASDPEVGHTAIARLTSSACGSATPRLQAGGRARTGPSAAS